MTSEALSSQMLQDSIPRLVSLVPTGEHVLFTLFLRVLALVGVSWWLSGVCFIQVQNNFLSRP